MTTALVSVTGLWLNEKKDKSGTYLSGSFGIARVYIFANKNKKQDKEPDYYLCIGNPPKRDTTDTKQPALPN